MALSMVVGPTELAVSVAEARLHTRVSDGEDDLVVETFIRAATERVHAITGLKLVTQTWRYVAPFFSKRAARAAGTYREFSENFSTIDLGIHGPNNYLYSNKNRSDMDFEIPVAPISSVSSVQYLDSGGVLQTLASNLYEVDTTGLIGAIRPAFGNDWPAIAAVPNAVRAQFVVGFGAATAIPDNLRLAIFLLISHYNLNREATTEKNLKDTPEAVEMLCSQHKLPWV